ncbi:hypothetical protein QE374_002790 [Microbacterium sp. SORGH_AS428]|uniref:endonuclease toxin domain-containing protein n=1 Tax=Microbacterium sp. SORGH_AS_0428 TaxID=3041788 RepID=UPI002856CC78|nr:hypothetical protein [Microbacterium sp. SORGH_AS_0428]MDR6200881.1 hypothetical protein [Microbacterium sp. SORGH_AS_0428]
MLIAVDPNAYYEAATCFGNGVASVVADAERALGSALAGSERIAGSDAAGGEWAAQYDQVAQLTAQTINDLEAAALTVAELLKQSGVNHAAADADSNPLGAILQSPAASWSSEVGVCVSVPSVAGGSIPTPDGWEQLISLVAITWPDGDAGKLRAVASAWRTVASTLESAWPAVTDALTSLDQIQSPEIDAARGVCITVGDAITDTATQARTLADAADEYAGHVDEVQAAMREQISILLAETVLIEAVAVAAGAATYGAGFVAGTGLAALNATKYGTRLTAIALRFMEGSRAVLASMAWHSLDATSASLRVVIAKTPATAATASVTGAAASLTALADKLAKSPWILGPSPRGFTIEARLGGNLPYGFRTIDRWDQAAGVATSIKSVNLASKTYQSPARLQRLLTGYIDKMAAYRGGTLSNVTVDEFDIVTRQLQLAIPTKGSSEQQAVIAAMAEYAQQRGVQLIVEVIR